MAGGCPEASARSSPCPTVPVLCFTGDGGFWYHIGELETALRHNVNLVIVVNDNRSLNQEKGPIDRAYDGKATQRAYDDLMMFSDVNLARVAEAMGCYAERVERPSDIGDAMARAFAVQQARRPRHGQRRRSHGPPSPGGGHSKGGPLM